MKRATMHVVDNAVFFLHEEFMMRKNRTKIKKKVIASLVMMCMATAISGFCFLSLSMKQNLVSIAEDKVAMSASVRPDQTYYGVVLVLMICMLFSFLYYLYRRDLKKHFHDSDIING